MGFGGEFHGDGLRQVQVDGSVLTQEVAVHTKAGLGVAELVPTWMPIITIYFICFQVVLGAGNPGNSYFETAKLAPTVLSSCF